MRNRTMRGLRIAATFSAIVLQAACAAWQPPTTLSTDARSRILAAATNPGGVPPRQPVDLRRLQAAALANPGDAALQAQWALAAEAAGDHAAAATARRAEIAAGRRDASVFLALGRAELRAGDAAAAAAAFEEAASLAPRSIEARTGIGLANDMLGESARAQAAHRTALVQAPTDWDLLGNLALSQVMGGDPAAAAQTLGRAETDVGAPRRARHNLALALGAAGERTRLLRLLGVDMARADAEAAAPEFARFGAWLAAGPDEPLPNEALARPVGGPPIVAVTHVPRRSGRR